MTASSDERRRAVASMIWHFSDDLADLDTRLGWSLSPLVLNFMTEAERQAVSSAKAAISQLRDELAGLARLGEAEVAGG